MSSVSGNEPSVTSARMRQIESILDRSRLAAGLPVLTEIEMRLASNVWAEILAPISTDWLDECYLRAIRAHNPALPFMAAELIRAWEQANKAGGVTASCPVCHGMGWWVDPDADWMGQQICRHPRLRLAPKGDQ